MKKKITLLILCFCLLYSNLYSLYAQEVVLSGLILDQTKTHLGRDFYEAFAQRWEFIPGLENYNIIINEISDPRWGTQIQIFVDDNLVYISPLKPRLEDIELRAEEAADAVFKYFFTLQEKEKAIQEEKTFF